MALNVELEPGNDGDGAGEAEELQSAFHVLGEAEASEGVEQMRLREQNGELLVVADDEEEKDETGDAA